MLVRLITLSILLTSCLPGKFNMRTVSKKKAVAEYEEKKFKLAFFDPAADKTFCPNVNVIFTSNTPDGASEYCLSDSGDPSQSCEWKSLPLDIKFKASSENQTLKKYLLFRNSEKVVLNETWESNELSVKPSTIAKTEAEQIRQLKTDELTENQMDEYLCRMDEWSYNVAKNIAMNVSDSFTQDRRVDMSHQLARMYYGDYGLPVKMSKDEISKIGWRLIVHTQKGWYFIHPKYSKFPSSTRSRRVFPDSLSGMDVSFIDMRNRNVTYLNFKGTNIRAEQLNQIDPQSIRIGLSGLDLKGWKPLSVSNVTGSDFSYAANLPWETINQISSLMFLRLDGLDLSNWNPTQSAIVAGISSLGLSQAINIPFDIINAQTTLSYQQVDLSNTDLKNWKPLPSINLGTINLSNAYNINWSYINANTMGLYQAELEGLDLSFWDPSSYIVVYGNNYLNSKNIPWTKLNSVTNANGLKYSNFEGQDLAQFYPGSNVALQGVSFEKTKNIPWTALNANISINGFMYTNFNGIDLSSWRPDVSIPVGASLVGSTNIPWDQLNANISSSNFMGMDLTGQDLSRWSPSPAHDLRQITFKNAKNIPWDKINLNTGSFQEIIFEGQDLSKWDPIVPKTFTRLNLKDTKNIPWTKLNSNATPYAFYGVNLSNLDLKNFQPNPNVVIADLILNNTTNLNWEYFNAMTPIVGGFQGISFIKLDLSKFNPLLSNYSVAAGYSSSRNVPWKILGKKSDYVFFYLNIRDLPNGFNHYNDYSWGRANNIEGFVPAHGFQIYTTMGTYNKTDLEEAAEEGGFKGVGIWASNGSGLFYPWGF